MSRDRTAWEVQWHIAADGTVIRQRSKGDQPHQQLYARYATRRPVSLADLSTMDDSLDHFHAFWNRATSVLLYGGMAAFVVALALLWFVGGLSLVLIALAPMIVVLALVTGLVARRLRQGGTRIYVDTGFDMDHFAVTMGAVEARAAIGEPGSVSGHAVRVDRA